MKEEILKLCHNFFYECVLLTEPLEVSNKCDVHTAVGEETTAEPTTPEVAVHLERCSAAVASSALQFYQLAASPSLAFETPIETHTGRSEKQSYNGLADTVTRTLADTTVSSAHKLDVDSNATVPCEATNNGVVSKDIGSGSSTAPTDTSGTNVGVGATSSCASFPKENAEDTTSNAMAAGNATRGVPIVDEPLRMWLPDVSKLTVLSDEELRRKLFKAFGMK